MTDIGFTLSSEECGPDELVRLARGAEEAGFDFVSISDHFHPWIDAQGNSPLVWATLGGIAQVTEQIRVATGVTCPTVRIHPAIVAQAAATVAAMMPGRFLLGLGAGENLNEHIVGQGWPEPAVRHERLEEAVAIIRELWRGELVSHHGRHFVVEEARIYTLPEEPPPVLIATGGERATRLAGEIGDGMFGLVPDPGVIELFEQSGGNGGAPKVGQVHVCWASDREEAERTAHRYWPTAALPGVLSWELRLPGHFEQASGGVSVEDVAEAVPCGPDPGPMLDAAREFVEAGYNHVYFHQIGPDQEPFLGFAERELLPELK